MEINIVQQLDRDITLGNLFLKKGLCKIWDLSPTAFYRGTMFAGGVKKKQLPEFSNDGGRSGP